MTDQQLLYLPRAGAREERIAAAAEQIDLDLGSEFSRINVESMDLPGRKQT